MKSLPEYNQPGKGLGAPLTSRDRILASAGITEADQAEAVKDAWLTKRALLQAGRVQYFSKDGVVIDQRTTSDNPTRLQAAEAIDRMVGVVAPPSKQTVEVVHRVVMPEWAQPDLAPSLGPVIDVIPTPSPASHAPEDLDA